MAKTYSGQFVIRILTRFFDFSVVSQKGSHVKLRKTVNNKTITTMGLSPNVLFDQVVPDSPLIERRKMFGYHCFFINGNMAGGLHEDNFILRLSPEDRVEFEKFGGHIFSPFPGRFMKEYSTIPRELYSDEDTIRSWIGKSIEYCSSLPEKKKK